MGAHRLQRPQSSCVRDDPSGIPACSCRRGGGGGGGPGARGRAHVDGPRGELVHGELPGQRLWVGARHVGGRRRCALPRDVRRRRGLQRDAARVPHGLGRVVAVAVQGLDQRERPGLRRHLRRAVPARAGAAAPRAARDARLAARERLARLRLGLGGRSFHGAADVDALRARAQERELCSAGLPLLPLHGLRRRRPRSVGRQVRPLLPRPVLLQ